MRQHSTQLEEVLSGDFTRSVSVNVFHGAERVDEGLAFSSWSMTSDLGARVTTSGGGAVVRESVDGEPWAPQGTKGALSPFRARVEPVMTITAGDFSEQVSLGQFRVTAAPSSRDFTTNVAGRDLVVASEVEAEFASLDEDVRRDGFRFPEATPEGASVFEEIRRLTGMPVEETVPDRTVPTVKAWEAKQGGRLDAVHELGRLLGGDIVVNARGAWEVIPDELGPTAVTLRVGNGGTVVDIAAEIDTDTVYNTVVGSFTVEDGSPFHSVAEVTTGPLAVDGPYGRHTRYYASDLVKTAEQGDAAVQAVLAQSVNTQQRDVIVQCHINPIVEVGDVAQVAGWTEPIVGRVVRVSMNDSHLMTVTLRVRKDLT